MENDDLVHAIQKLGSKVMPECVKHPSFIRSYWSPLAFP
jgi:hypothetical protein